MQQSQRAHGRLRSEHLNALDIVESAQRPQEGLESGALSVFQFAQGAKRDPRLVRDGALIEIAEKAQLSEAMPKVMLQV